MVSDDQVKYAARSAIWIIDNYVLRFGDLNQNNAKQELEEVRSLFQVVLDDTTDVFEKCEVAFMAQFEWTVKHFPIPHHSGGMLVKDLKPNDILFYYDEPLLFVVSCNPPVMLLCQKYNEDGDISKYLCVGTDDAIIERLKSGQISVRDALRQPICWLVETNSDFVILKSTNYSLTDIPNDIMPDEGCGLYPYHGFIKDKIDD